MMASAIAFGTEGWRGVMADDFTTANVRIVAQAMADHLKARGGRRGPVAIGWDSRFLSDTFARTVAEVLAGNGLRVVLSAGVVPTCAVSRYVVAKRLPAGVMVTASHNPAVYNGIKVKEAFGGSATTETVASIERRLGRAPVKRLAFEEATAARRVRPADFLPPFLAGIRSSLDLASIRRRRFRVVVDSMFGAGGRLIERVVAGGRCRIDTLHGEPDPRFGGRAPEPIAANLAELMTTVRRARADLGIATDGDADRLGIIGPGGAWLNPGQVLCVLLMHLVTVRRQTGAVVKTVSNTMLINRLTQALGLRLIEVPVGFKHIAKLMLEQDVVIGGEESGGIGVAGYLPERDGIFNGLLVLEAIAASGRSLSALVGDLERRFGRFWYGRRDLQLRMAQVDGLFRRLAEAPPQDLAGVAVARVNTMDGVKLIGRDDSWLLFRRSGTEPIVRIYAETPRRSRLPRLLRLGVRLAEGR